MKKTFTAMVAALVALSIIMASPASAGVSPIYMPDGSQRNDIELVQSTYSDMLIVYNYSNGTVQVEYSDSMYGSQVATLTPEGTVTMCANENEVSEVFVTYSPGTSKAVTGYGYYMSVASGSKSLEALQAQVASSKKALVKAKKALVKAKKALKRAKKRHRSAPVIRKAQRKVRLVQAKVRVAKMHLSVAREDLRKQQAAIAYCVERRVD